MDGQWKKQVLGGLWSIFSARLSLAFQSISYVNGRLMLKSQVNSEDHSFNYGWRWME